MPGGLLNLVSYGSQNVILNGNPSKTFFKCAYAKYTNFGLQKFRIDFDGLRNLRMSESSEYTVQGAEICRPPNGHIFSSDIAHYMESDYSPSGLCVRLAAIRV